MDAEVRWNSGDFGVVRSLLRISMRPPRAGAVQVDHPLGPSSRGGTTWTAPSRVRQRSGHPARRRHADGRCARCCGRQSARRRRCRRRCGRGYVLAVACSHPVQAQSSQGASRESPAVKGGKVAAWGDDVVLRIVECHPPQYRPLAAVGAACGLRQGEIFGLAEEDIDFDELVIHVRRQVKKLGRTFVFALPKNDTDRDVPLSEGAGPGAGRRSRSVRPWNQPLMR
jgi:integrase